MCRDSEIAPTACYCEDLDLALVGWVERRWRSEKTIA